MRPSMPNALRGRAWSSTVAIAARSLVRTSGYQMNASTTSGPRARAGYAARCCEGAKKQGFSAARSASDSAAAGLAPLARK
eukprot:COSAG01_NODE_21934_length_878_cov_3.510911_2_plen_81_part_01